MAGPISRWRTVLGTVIVAYGLLVLLGLGLIYSGAYNIGADNPHWGLTYRIFEAARIRSIREHAAEITPPAKLDDQGTILIGVEHFADHCAVCHGAPGVPRGDIADGLYPQPPDLAVTSKRYTDGELFWMLKHGIKMTGMPSWADHGDDELWATVAFIRKLPEMTPEDYAKLVAHVMSHGMQHQPSHEAQPQSAGSEREHPAGHQH